MSKNEMLWAKMSKPRKRGLSCPKAKVIEEPNRFPSPAQVESYLKSIGVVSKVTAEECIALWMIERPAIPGVKEAVDVPPNWLKWKGQKLESNPPVRTRSRPLVRKELSRKDISKQAACRLLTEILTTWKPYRRLQKYKNPRHEAWLSDCYVAILEARLNEVKKSKTLGISLPPYQLFRLGLKRKGKIPPSWGKLFRTLAFRRCTEGFDVGERQRSNASTERKRYLTDQAWSVLEDTHKEADIDDDGEISLVTRTRNDVNLSAETNLAIKIAKKAGLTKDDPQHLKVLCAIIELSNATVREQAEHAGMSESSFYFYKASLCKKLGGKKV